MHKFMCKPRYAGAQPLTRALCCASSNDHATETVCDCGRPILAETDGQGGPLVAGDHLFRDRTNPRNGPD